MPFLAIVLFIAILAVAMLSAAVAMKLVESHRRRRVNRLLTSVNAIDHAPKVVSVIRPSEAPASAWRAWVRRSRVYRSTEKRLESSGLNWTPDRVLALSVALGGAGVVTGWSIRLLFSPFAGALALGQLGLFGPWLMIERARKKRIANFETQFPDALDFLGRSVRAGHAFSVSLDMLASESPEPVRSEFRRVTAEQNLGASLEDALDSLCRRMPLLDVRFFSSAVLLQKETGGNLSEILEKLSHVIRERFRIRGQVRSLTAHSRITAKVLTALPLVVIGLLSVVAPGYLAGMNKDTAGRWMLIGSGVAQVLGYAVMKKIINIKV
jgi:tight adherence protein B